MNLFNLKKELKEMIDAHTCTVTPEMELMRDFNFKQIKKQSRLERKSYSILDMNEKRFTFHVSAHEKWLPAPVINIEDSHNGENIQKLTHPDDLPKVIENELRGYYFLQELPFEEKENFQFIYMRRLMDQNRGFQLFLHKVSVLQIDSFGETFLLQFCTEHLPAYFSDLSLIGDFYLLFPPPLPDRKKRKIFVNNTWITEQEIKILQLVFNGNDLRTIAEILNVAENTVKTHFTTIRKKLNIKNIQMAAIFAKLTGILMQLLFLWIEWGKFMEEIVKEY